MRSCQLRQISVCQFSSRSWSFEEDLARYETLGFDSVGIWRKKLDDLGHHQAIDLLHESNLTVSSLHHAGGFTGDGATFNESINDTLDAIRLAAKINAGVLLIHPGAINNHLFKHAANLYQKALDEIVPFAESLDVQLAIEPILDQPNSQFTFQRSIDETIGLLETNPSLGVALDLYHVGLDTKAFERLQDYVAKIKLVQLADRTDQSWDRQRLAGNRRKSFRLPLGDGVVQIHKWLQRLNELGYKGAFELEVFGGEVEHNCTFELLDQTMSFMANATLRAIKSKAAKSTGTLNPVPTKKFTAN